MDEDRRIRPARRDESGDIARLFLVSSDGLAAYIWSRLDMPGPSLGKVGAARYTREDTAFSYQNCLVALEDDAVVGMLHAFPMHVDPAGPAEADPVLRPYAELEADGSLYVSGLAVEAPHRGRGIGGALMAEGEALARRHGLTRVSLICFERNEGAMRFYARLGYQEQARRPIVPHPTLHYAGGDAVLLVKGEV